MLQWYISEISPWKSKNIHWTSKWRTHCFQLLYMPFCDKLIKFWLIISKNINSISFWTMCVCAVSSSHTHLLLFLYKNYEYILLQILVAQTTKVSIAPSFINTFYKKNVLQNHSSHAFIHLRCRFKFFNN